MIAERFVIAAMIGALVFAAVPAVASADVIAEVPRKPPRTAPAAPPPVTTTELARLYVRAGRELANLGKTDPELASELWPRFRWIRFNDALTTPEKRAEAARILENVLVITRGRGSAAD